MDICPQTDLFHFSPTQICRSEAGSWQKEGCKPKLSLSDGHGLTTHSEGTETALLHIGTPDLSWGRFPHSLPLPHLPAIIPQPPVPNPQATSASASAGLLWDQGFGPRKLALSTGRRAALPPSSQGLPPALPGAQRQQRVCVPVPCRTWPGLHLRSPRGRWPRPSAQSSATPHRVTRAPLAPMASPWQRAPRRFRKQAPPRHAQIPPRVPLRLGHAPKRPEELFPCVTPKTLRLKI